MKLLPLESKNLTRSAEYNCDELIFSLRLHFLVSKLSRSVSGSLSESISVYSNSVFEVFRFFGKLSISARCVLVVRCFLEANCFACFVLLEKSLNEIFVPFWIETFVVAFNFDYVRCTIFSENTFEI